MMEAPPDTLFADRALVTMANVMGRRAMTPPKQVRCVVLGLSLQDRWRVFLESGGQERNDMYALARLLVYALELHEDGRLNTHQATPAGDILKAWLSPAELGLSVPSVPSVSQACTGLFGRSWCDFHGLGGSDVIASVLVSRDRPPFVSGVLRSASIEDAYGLPALEF